MENKDNLKNIEFLDSIDDRKNRVFNIVYLVLAFWFILTPFTSTLFDMINSPIELVTQGVMISIFFGVVWLVEFSLKITKLKFKKLTLFEYLGLALVVLFVLQIFINSAYGIGGVLFYTSYILILPQEKPCVNRP